MQEAFIAATGHESLTQQDLDLLIETFARHELGYVPAEYSAAIVQLSERFRLGLVVDIWAPKTLWINALNQCGVLPLCEAAFFSSDTVLLSPHHVRSCQYWNKCKQVRKKLYLSVIQSDEI